MTSCSLRFANLVSDHLKIFQWVEHIVNLTLAFSNIRFFIMKFFCRTMYSSHSFYEFWFARSKDYPEDFQRAESERCLYTHVWFYHRGVINTYQHLSFRFSGHKNPMSKSLHDSIHYFLQTWKRQHKLLHIYFLSTWWSGVLIIIWL